MEREWNGQELNDPYGTYGFPTQDSSSQYTTTIYSLPWNVVDGQMDLQVEALEGYTNRTIDPSRAHIIWAVYEYTFYGEESGWSSTQTVTLGVGSVSVSASPNPTLSPTNSPITNNTQLSAGSSPAVPEFPAIIIVPLLLSPLLGAIMLKPWRVNYVQQL